jgi:hypothetical protein
MTSIERIRSRVTIESHDLDYQKGRCLSCGKSTVSCLCRDAMPPRGDSRQGSCSYVLSSAHVARSDIRSSIGRMCNRVCNRKTAPRCRPSPHTTFSLHRVPLCRECSHTATSGFQAGCINARTVHRTSRNRSSFSCNIHPGLTHCKCEIARMGGTYVRAARGKHGDATEDSTAGEAGDCVGGDELRGWDRRGVSAAGDHDDAVLQVVPAVDKVG